MEKMEPDKGMANTCDKNFKYAKLWNKANAFVQKKLFEILNNYDGV